MREHSETLLSKFSSTFMGGGKFSRIPILFLCMLALAVPAFASHISHVEISPAIVAGSVNDQLFTVNVCNDEESSDAIHEFRIYYEWLQFGEFTDVKCQPKAGWDLTYPITNWGKACMYSSTSPANNIGPGICTMPFYFTADTPATECCRTLTFDTRDVNNGWQFHYKDVCVDTKPPVTTKILGDPKKVENGVEWISGITPITLTAVDPQPHPSGLDKTWYANILLQDEQACYNPQQYCPDYVNQDDIDEYVECGLPIQDECKENYTGYKSWQDCTEQRVYDECDVPEEWKIYQGPFTKNEESCHVLYFFSIDNVGNWEQVQKNCFFVDTSVPDVVKKMGLGPKFGNCPPEPGNPEDKCYITSDTEIKLECEDGWQGSSPHPSGSEVIWWRYRYTEDGQNWSEWLPGEDCDGEYGEDGWCDWDEVKKIKFPESSMHELQWYCEDAVGNTTETDTEYFRVDNDEPVIEKTMFGQYLGTCPPKNEGDICYVADNGTSGVDITVTDGESIHASDNVNCYYEVWWEGQMIDVSKFTEYAHVTFYNDSTHQLKVHCEDAVGNSADDIEEFLVDSEPPVTTKTYGDPKYPDVEHPMWITSETSVTLTPFDEKVGVEETYWRNMVITSEEGWNACYYPENNCNPEFYHQFVNLETPWNAYEAPFFKEEESCHVIEYYSVDKFGYKEEVKYQCVFVDNSAPDMIKEVGDPKLCGKNLKNAGFETGDFTNWTIEEQVDSVSVVGADGFTSPQMGSHMAKLGDETSPQPIGMNRISQAFTVTEPTLTFAYNIFTYDYKGYNHFGYTLTRVSDGYVIAQYSQDAWGNWGDTSLKTTGWRNVSIDLTAYIGEQLKLELFSGGTIDTLYPTWTYVDCAPYWVSQNTEISLDCDDPAPHPVENETLCYKVSYDLAQGGYITGNYCEEFGGNMGEGGWCCTNMDSKEGNYKFNFMEDSMHDLEFYCEDALGNKTSPHTQWYRVDTTAPTIEKIINGPKYGDCPPEEPGDICYIDGVTTISVNATDGGDICHVDDVTCKWGYYLDQQPKFYGWYTEFPINFPEETAHSLTIECTDALGNTASDIEMFYVDKTPPVTTHAYGLPYYIDGSGNEWITSNTSVTLNVDDAGPHKSGIKETKYRVTLVADDYCYNSEMCSNYQTGELPAWNIYTGSFTIPEQSCHIIEYYSKDNVDKTETVKKDCVFVDNSAPATVKTVGEPKDVWDGKDAAYYDIDVFCETPGNCWKVTLLTPISLDCNDMGPHPVDHDYACFYVELDADNATGNYCQKYGGVINEADGYCCMQSTVPEFYFTEETEHNLKYYCTDALGNKGAIDDEKFKVEGTTFEIQLNKKWNLVSVPFVLINNDIGEVLKDVKDNVESVWTYDSFNDEWYVYHPASPGTSNLYTMDPGWGYWLRAYNADLLTIGGSLFNPITTPPSRNLKAGWNIVGYYGADGITKYDGPHGEGRTAQCVFYSLKEDIWDIPFSSLATYWEPYNPNQWVFLNADSRMDPGAGYWVMIPKDGIYSYTTDCGPFY